MLGQSIAESANATRRAFVKRDCDNGMLDSRKLTEIGSGVNLDRVFMQQKPARSQKISVELLVDVSGSMESMNSQTNEQIITTAASMCKSIVEAFNKAKVDCKVYAYNHKTHIAKDYKTRQVSWENLYCDGKTYMGHAMETSLRSLRVRNADRKMMLVISDGDAGCMASEVAVTARTHRIETYGFFIGVPTPDEISRTFTTAFGELSPTACVNEVCGAVRRSLAVV
jgi:nitric oxide reductase activation protein